MSSAPRLWIDTSQLARAEHLFGIAPMERMRRTLRTIVADAGSVTISGAAASGVSWPGTGVQ
ncbi:MAG: hypothetical protein ABW071_08170, partial [Casimicrobiaceae bacterium]